MDISDAVQSDARLVLYSGGLHDMNDRLDQNGNQSNVLGPTA